MTIISFEHKFIFLKTKKVAGTSVEALLRPLTGPNDIVPCVTPRDEYYSASQGHFSKNYAENPNDEKIYTQLVLDKKFEQAMAFLQKIDKKYISHMNTKKIKNIVEAHGYNYDDFFKFTIERHPYTWMISMAAYNNKKYNAGELTKNFDVEKIRRSVEKILNKDDFSRLMNWNLYADNQGPRMDMVIKYEDLHGGLNTVCQNIGLEIDSSQLPELKINARHMDPNIVLTSSLKQMINERFSKVFEYMEYSK